MARYDRARIAGVAWLRGIGPVSRAHPGGRADIAAGSRPWRRGGESGVTAGASVSRAVAGPERWVPKNGSDLLPAGKSGAGGKNRLGHQGIRTPSPFFL